MQASEALDVLHAHLESHRDIAAPTLLLRLMHRLKISVSDLRRTAVGPTVARWTKQDKTNSEAAAQASKCKHKWQELLKRGTISQPTISSLSPNSSEGTRAKSANELRAAFHAVDANLDELSKEFEAAAYAECARLPKADKREKQATYAKLIKSLARSLSESALLQVLVADGVLGDASAAIAVIREKPDAEHLLREVIQPKPSAANKRAAPKRIAAANQRGAALAKGRK